MTRAEVLEAIAGAVTMAGLAYVLLVLFFVIL